MDECRKDEWRTGLVEGQSIARLLGLALKVKRIAYDPRHCGDTSRDKSHKIFPAWDVRSQQSLGFHYFGMLNGGGWNLGCSATNIGWSLP